MKRFVICPGHVISRSDGDRHFIGAGQLIRLYGVNPAECLISQENGLDRTTLDWTKYIALMPRYNGDYEEHLKFKLAEKGWEL